MTEQEREANDRYYVVRTVPTGLCSSPEAGGKPAQKGIEGRFVHIEDAEECRARALKYLNTEYRVTGRQDTDGVPVFDSVERKRANVYIDTFDSKGTFIETDEPAKKPEPKPELEVEELVEA